MDYPGFYLLLVALPLAILALAVLLYIRTATGERDGT